MLSSQSQTHPYSNIFFLDCHARKLVLQGVEGGGAANSTDLSFIFCTVSTQGYG